jgi:hypothetical protein
MMRRLVMLWAVVLVSAGCGAVQARRPVGDNAVDLTGHEAKWNGVWMHNEGAVTIVVADSSNGVLRLGWAEAKDHDVALKSTDVYLRKADKWTLASMPAEDSAADGSPLYVWGRVENADRQILLWIPKTDVFRAGVVDGRLAGTTNGANVILDGPSAGELELIMEESAPHRFHWDHPLVFTRIAQ